MRKSYFLCRAVRQTTPYLFLRQKPFWLPFSRASILAPSSSCLARMACSTVACSSICRWRSSSFCRLRLSFSSFFLLSPSSFFCSSNTMSPPATVYRKASETNLEASLRACSSLIFPTKILPSFPSAPLRPRGKSPSQACIPPLPCPAHSCQRLRTSRTAGGNGRQGGRGRVGRVGGRGRPPATATPAG